MKPARLAPSEAVRAWVDAFAEGWRAPSDPESFAEHFIPWFDPDIRLVAPLMPTAVGIRAFRERFVRPVFIQFPDLRGSVLGWAASGDVVYIELLLVATIGRRRVEWVSVDRITLRGDKVVERIANFDPTSIVSAVARTPSVWPRFVRARIAASRPVAFKRRGP
jgi:hypothetical protein